jgi:hypothetical protein
MHQRLEEEDLMEIAKLPFPRQDRILGFLKGASGGIYPIPSVRALTTCQITLTGVFKPAMRVFLVSEK